MSAAGNAVGASSCRVGSRASCALRKVRSASAARSESAPGRLDAMLAGACPAYARYARERLISRKLAGLMRHQYWNSHVLEKIATDAADQGFA